MLRGAVVTKMGQAARETQAMASPRPTLFGGLASAPGL